MLIVTQQLKIFPALCGTKKDHYCLHKSPPLSLSQMNQMHNLPPNLFKKHLNIVTDLINALPGNSSVNTAQHAAVDEAVFSGVRAEQRWNNGGMQPVSKQRLGEHTSA
jgi:hypothetical protein